MWVVQGNIAMDVRATRLVQEGLSSGRLRLPDVGELRRLPSRFSDRYAPCLDLRTVGQRRPEKP